MKQLAYILFSCLYSVVYWGQTAAEDFKKISSAFGNNQNISMNIEYNVYENHAAKISIDNQKGFYRRNGSSICNRLMNYESLTAEGKTLIVDESERKITIGKASKVPMPGPASIDIEKSISLFGKITLSDISRNEKCYHLTLKKNAAAFYEKIEVYFNPQTYTVSRMVFYYSRAVDFSGGTKAQKPRVELQFNDVVTKPRFSDDEFSFSRFVVKKGKLYQPSEKYKGYKVIEQS